MELVDPPPCLTPPTALAIQPEKATGIDPDSCLYRAKSYGLNLFGAYEGMTCLSFPTMQEGGLGMLGDFVLLPGSSLNKDAPSWRVTGS